MERLKVLKLYFVLFLFAVCYVLKLKALCELVSKSPIAKNLHNVFKRMFIFKYTISILFRIVGLEFCTIYVESMNGLMDPSTMVHWWT